jgi:Domain of unknown function (DUF4145)
VVEELDMVSLLEEIAIFRRKEWPINMEVTVCNVQQGHVTVRGTCPHCGHPSVFSLMTSLGATPRGERLGGMQCQGCLNYILAVFITSGHMFQYVRHFPLGKPDETVAEEIPDGIKGDFKEALRCRFVDAYNATAEMCRRALEASCIDLGASPKDVLEDMIDELEAQRKITPFLKQVAHKIRLGGNRGAHPSPPPPASPQAELGIASGAEIANSGSIRIITKEHADAIIKFTHEFFHHVYVVPKTLDKYDFSKPKP